MNDLQSARMGEVQRGAGVVTADGQTLGKVGETRPEHFHVEADGRGNFWLERSDIAAVTREAVTVGFAAADLPQHHRSDPGAAHVVGASSTQPAYIRGASPAEANELADPNVSR